MQLAYTMSDKPGGLDSVLFKFSEHLTTHGLRTAGVVQINTSRVDCNPCDMDVKVLPDGPVLRISQSLGKEARGCRLDPEALETAVQAVTKSLADDVDALIVNKFGKHEADGRGFREVIAEAMGRNIPVIVGVNRLNEAAFKDFAGGTAVQLPADVGSLASWLKSNTRRAVA